ncbi:hypothetical protein CRG98_011480 [Punica granatum]|uniref:Uncharacterized protein n=1 Tax=Punica granatum TaxID=22663 RepID=A0A2I0KI81_PUNGR|nr:hypothetical protein CRG98_011480 [Punica granatum]
MTSKKSRSVQISDHSKRHSHYPEVEVSERDWVRPRRGWEVANTRANRRPKGGGGGPLQPSRCRQHNSDTEKLNSSGLIRLIWLCYPKRPDPYSKNQIRPDPLTDPARPLARIVRTMGGDGWGQWVEMAGDDNDEDGMGTSRGRVEPKEGLPNAPSRS